MYTELFWSYWHLRGLQGKMIPIPNPRQHSCTCSLLFKWCQTSGNTVNRFTALSSAAVVVFTFVHLCTSTNSGKCSCLVLNCWCKNNQSKIKAAACSCGIGNRTHHNYEEEAKQPHTLMWSENMAHLPMWLRDSANLHKIIFILSCHRYICMYRSLTPNSGTGKPWKKKCSSSCLTLLSWVDFSWVSACVWWTHYFRVTLLCRSLCCDG